MIKLLRYLIDPVAIFTLFLCGFTTNSVAQEKENKPISPLQKWQNTYFGRSIFLFYGYAHFPHYTRWDNTLLPNRYYGQTDSIKKGIREFHNELVAALSDPNSPDHDATVVFFARYTCQARYHARENHDQNLPAIVERALAPHTDLVREKLKLSLKSKEPKTRILAAISLLALDDKNAEADLACKALPTLTNIEDISLICRNIGLGNVNSPEIIGSLRKMLRHPDVAICHEAAKAVILMGPSARETVPELIGLLKSGEDAIGQWNEPMFTEVPHFENLALLALEKLGVHAKPARAVLLEHLQNPFSGNPYIIEQQQLLILTSLANIGCRDEECLKGIRNAMKSKISNVKLAACCTLLKLVHNDKTAIDILKKSLTNQETQTSALSVCTLFAVPAEQFLPIFNKIILSDDEVNCSLALKAIAKIGPDAASSIPIIENAISKKRDDNFDRGTFLENVCFALLNIRGKRAAEIVLRLASQRGPYASDLIVYLSGFGDDLPDNTPAILLQIAKSNDLRNDNLLLLTRNIMIIGSIPLMPFEFDDHLFEDPGDAHIDPRKITAAVALGNLGERALSVRHEMEQMVNDPEIGWLISSALRRIPTENTK